MWSRDLGRQRRGRAKSERDVDSALAVAGVYCEPRGAEASPLRLRAWIKALTLGVRGCESVRSSRMAVRRSRDGSAM
jgi:hypothetical protein